MTSYERRRVFDPKTMGYKVDLVPVGVVESDPPPEGALPSSADFTDEETRTAEEAVTALLTEEDPRPKPKKKRKLKKRKANAKKKAE